MTAYFAFSASIRYALSLYLYAEQEELHLKLAPLQNVINEQLESIKKLSRSISEEEVVKKITAAKELLLEEEQKKILALTQEYNQKIREEQNDKEKLEDEYKKQISELRQKIATESSLYEESLRAKNQELIQIEKFVGEQKEKIKEQEQLIERLHKEQDEFIATQEKLSSDKINNTIIFDSDIYKALKEAIVCTEKELDIMSPWVSESVVTNEIRTMIRSLVNRGATIKIIYGMKKDDNRLENTEKTIQSIRRYCGENGVNVKAKYLVSHSKLIICDNKFYIITSCNPLSHKGNQWKEIGEKSTNTENLQKYRDKYFQF